MNQPAPWDDNSDEDEDLDAREPWMWGGKRAFIFLIDMSESMFAPDIKDSTYFQECIKACKKIMLSKIIQQENDLIGIVIFGTKHKDQVGQPDHIWTLQDIEKPSAEKLNKLLEIEADLDDFERKMGHSKDFSISDALWHCNKLFNNCKIKLFEKTIILLTSNDNPHSANPSLQNNACKRANDLKCTSIFLRVLPLGLKFEMKNFYQELMDAANGVESDTCAASKSVDDILSSFEHSYTKRSIGKLVWNLGENVKLGVGTYTICRTACMPKKAKIERTKNEVVQSRAQFFNAESGEEVIRSDIVKSTKIADELVTFDPVEVQAAKQISSRGLVLLGFKPIKRIKIHRHLKSPLFIYPEERLISGSRLLFAALHTQCLKRKVAALCHFTARHNSRPELVALVPQSENLGSGNVQLTPPGFVLVFLPFADNIRDLSKHILKCPDPDPQLMSLAERILDAIQFDYDPHAIDNPRLAFHWAGIEAIALNYSDAKVPTDHTLPDKSLDEKIDLLASEFMNIAFPEGFNEKKITSSAKAKQKSQENPKTNPKKAKMEVDPSNMEDLVRSGLVEKLKVDQLKEFLTEKGVRTSKMRKDQLVKAVYDHFNIDQPE